MRVVVAVLHLRGGEDARVGVGEHGHEQVDLVRGRGTTRGRARARDRGRGRARARAGAKISEQVHQHDGGEQRVQPEEG